MSAAVLEMPIAPPVEDTKLSRVLRWQRGETPGPWEMQVHPTNRCNLKCKICWERRAEKTIGMKIYDRTVEVSDERLLRLVDEAAEMEVREWTIVGGGEPMVRDELVIAMCERIHGHGMKAALHTNATRFKQSHFERLIEAGLDRLRFSLDGPTADTNNVVRSGGFEKVVANMKMLKEMKAAYGVRHPIVSMHPVITNITYQNLDKLVELAHELGAEGMGLGHLNFEYPGEEGAVLELTKEQMAEAPEHILKARRRAHELGMYEEFDALLPDDERNVASKPYLGRTCCDDNRLSDAACYEAWLSCVIHVTGQMGPCCVSYDDGADNIKDMSFRDAWLGPFMQDVRRRIVTRDLNRFCASCHKTYIEPRSEVLRYDLLETIPMKDRAQWNKWGEVAPGNKAALLAGRFGDAIRRHGIKHALKKAWEWKVTQSR